MTTLRPNNQIQVTSRRLWRQTQATATSSRPVSQRARHIPRTPSPVPLPLCGPPHLFPIDLLIPSRPNSPALFSFFFTHAPKTGGKIRPESDLAIFTAALQFDWTLPFPPVIASFLLPSSRRSLAVFILHRRSISFCIHIHAYIRSTVAPLVT